MQVCREGSRAPTKPQGTEKTTNYNLAEGRGESQEEQPTPRTIQKNGLEGRPAKAEELDPTRKVVKSDRKITLNKRRDANRYATRRWRGTIQATKVAKTDTSANQESPRGEMLEQEGQRERERSGLRRMKRRTGNLEPQTKASRKGTVHQAETANSPQGNPGNSHKGAQNTDRNLDRGSRPQRASQKSNLSRRTQD